MNDRYDQDTILGYVEGELDEAQRASFEAVIADDHELRNLVSQMKLDRQALRSLSSKPAPVGLVDQVMQAQERAALLGEPDVPEPLPMVLPVSRLKLRRVLAYSGVAAVLLLSAALVIPTLMPSGLLDRQSPIAFLDKTPPAPAAKHNRALIDEDAAYDRAAAPRSLARTDADDADIAAKSAAPEAATALVEDIKVPEVKVAKADADAAKDDAETPTAAAAIAMTERVEAPEPAAALRETPAEPKAEAMVAKAVTDSDDVAATLTEPVKPEADKPAEKVELARAEPVNPFAGYGGAISDTRITDDSRLLINAASPTLARRDLRDWAIANSARVEEQSAVSGLRGATATTAPDRGLARGMAGTLGTPDTREPAGQTPAGSTQVVVEIDPSKVDELLAYLNRNTDQRAELITQVDEVAATPATGRDTERARKRRVERLAREAERTQPADQNPGPDQQHGRYEVRAGPSPTSPRAAPTSPPPNSVRPSRISRRPRKPPLLNPPRLTPPTGWPKMLPTTTPHGRHHRPKTLRLGQPARRRGQGSPSRTPGVAPHAGFPRAAAAARTRPARPPDGHHPAGPE
ncbi:MAG: hypothetical protein R3C45_03720 [Phycisphaerales bacterium]